MFLDIANYFWVFALILCPGWSGIEVMTIGTCYVGNVPDGVSTWTILQGSTGHGIGKLLHHLGSICQLVPGS